MALKLVLKILHKNIFSNFQKLIATRFERVLCSEQVYAASRNLERQVGNTEKKAYPSLFSQKNKEDALVILNDCTTYTCTLLKFVGQFALVLSKRSFVYEQDLSEHCKRRAIPSVFLGEHLSAAASKTMLFSKSELPYNCFITVKTEPANDIVLVIQKVVLSDLEEACTEHSDQLLVFEMGESFGGYWGPMIKKNFDFNEEKTERHTVFYTLQTTKPTTKAVIESSESEEELNTSPVTESTTENWNVNEEEPKKKMIVEEFPLLELSGRLADAAAPWAPAAAPEDLANLDVAPKIGEKYVTNMIPIVEVAVSEQSEEDASQTQLYRLDYEVDFDPRISSRKHNQIVNKGVYTTRSRLFSKKLVTQLDKSYKHESFKDHRTSSPGRSLLPTSTTHSWEHLMELLNSIDTKYEGKLSNVSRDFENITKRKNNNQFIKLRETEKSTHYASYKSKDKSKFSESHISTTTLSKSVPENKSDARNKKTVSSSSSQYNGEIMTKSSQDTATSISNTITTESNSKVATEFKNYSTEKESTTYVTGAMVGHESWENVVQAAPKMAIILNQSTANEMELDSNQNIGLKQKPKKKRHIQAVLIENAKPHTLSTRATRTRPTDDATDTASSYEFAQFVEIQDDEVHGRAHLRYLRQFVGPMIYNICESIEESKQQLQRVHLFNSSRIVIAINNFTLSTMSLISTTVRLLPSSTMQCPSSHLECQVSGARVCVDKCVSCDGVPNCGSSETYDEDRHLCGGNSLNYDVYLAAVTFLAVLCTVLYIVHYWIKRCVPKVSDAFFVYTDGAENVLYLDTIMRSPNEMEESSKIHHGNIFEDDMIPYLPQNERKSVFRSFMSKLNFLLRSKSGRHFTAEPESQKVTLERSKIYSFQALEIKKMMNESNTVDESIQTGPSLELKQISSACKKPPGLTKDIESQNVLTVINKLSSNHNRELNIIKLMQKERPEHGPVTPRPSENKIELHLGSAGSAGSAQRSAGTEEEELRSTLYESHRQHSQKISKNLSADSYEIDQPGTSGYGRKRLRFEEASTDIPSTSQDPQIDEIKDTTKKHEVVYGTESGPKDFMWFWTGSKNKKNKKKPLPPRAK